VLDSRRFRITLTLLRQGTAFYPELAKGSRAATKHSKCGFSRCGHSLLTKENRMRRFGVLITALIAILFAFPLWAQTVAIRAGNVIDPATGKVSTNQIILIKDQKIAEIGPSVSIPSDAQVIDLSN
jgi:hypothetical protein